MTRRLVFAGERQAEGLVAFLGRLLRYDRGAAVRLRAAPGTAGGGAALAVFGHAPALEVIVVRTVLLAAAEAAELDETVSAGQLAEAVDAAAGTGDTAEVAVALPGPVSGPGWAGLLPPRGGWEPVAGLPGPAELYVAVATGVAEFKARVEALPEEKRTRTEVDRIGGDIWSRPLDGTPLPLRAAHAARVFGLLPPPPAPPGTPAPAPAAPAAGPSAGSAAEPALLAAGNWLRLRTPYGSVAVRRTGGLGRLGVTPL
ncbi:hypothetical protein [Streptomyces sp. MAR4 CNX-425]|uniref:hypothetical protein n=1 Tax=Streptomyces sp. MAR4 CNX-425 TaxID=3406343 RepID=UPI003B50679D